MRGVRRAHLAGRSVAVKRYASDDTERYMCIGSGACNEALLRPPAARLAPALVAYERSDDDEIAFLEWIDGDTLPPERVDATMARRAADVLELIHSVEGDAFGSLDGRFRFDSATSAFGARWRVALGLLSDVDGRLARSVARWGEPRVAALEAACRRASLVHGDFGPANLVWGARDEPVVIDWEHARYGDEREDWAKILLSFRFPEPNGFDTAVAHAVTHPLRARPRAYVTADAMDLYLVYFAATLGAFFDDAARLEWLGRVAAGALRPPLLEHVAPSVFH